MTTENLRAPLLKQGWLRVLLFFIVFFILLVGASFPLGAALIKWKENQATDFSATEMVQKLSGEYLWVTVLISLSVSLVTVFLFRRFVDRRSIRSLGFETEGYLADGLTGLFLAVGMLGLGTLILFLSKHLHWTDILFDGKGLFIGLGIMVMVAISEELVFRGYILNNLMQSFNKWIALAISAALFTVFHMANPGAGFIPLFNIFLAGILLGLNYVYTKNLWFAIIFHLAWNFVQGPLLGYQVSGVNMPTLLQTELQGDALLTGGDFGFEGSVFDMAITLLAILGLFLAYERKFGTGHAPAPVVV